MFIATFFIILQIKTCGKKKREKVGESEKNTPKSVFSIKQAKQTNIIIKNRTHVKLTAPMSSYKRIS
jgi:hypothetical protein